MRFQAQANQLAHCGGVFAAFGHGDLAHLGGVKGINAEIHDFINRPAALGCGLWLGHNVFVKSFEIVESGYQCSPRLERYVGAAYAFGARR